LSASGPAGTRRAEMALIPAGEFFMGYDGMAGSGDEHPRHPVLLAAFRLDIHPVTVARYREFCRASGRPLRSQPEYSNDDHPVVDVDWDDAQAYCGWAGLRLPTEAEWEKAARGGTCSLYGFGDYEADLDEHAWYSANSEGRTHPVASKQPNAYGLYDMHGNVLEWVADWYAADYYGRSPARDPRGPDSGACRVFRGSSFDSDEVGCRVANRYKSRPDTTNCHFGFRCAAAAAK